MKREDFLCKIQKDIASLFEEKRLRHVLSTRDKALEIADIFVDLGAELDRFQVETAALLHDATKRMNQLELCEKYGITLTQQDKAAPQVLHSFTGAYYAREKYGVSEEVFSAIYNHTVGAPDMSLLEEIIFVADYAEDTRQAEACRQASRRIREIKDACGSAPDERALSVARGLLDEIVLEILENTASYVAESGRSLHSGALSALEYYKKKCENKNGRTD